MSQFGPPQPTTPKLISAYSPKAQEAIAWGLSEESIGWVAIAARGHIRKTWGEDVLQEMECWIRGPKGSKKPPEKPKQQPDLL